MASVSRILYERDGPTIKLFTKEGCTLCDKVKDILHDIRDEHPHSLILMDITDRCYEKWYAKYKFDIPVLHINDRYWAKHRLSRSQAIQGIRAANEGTFRSPKGMPDAASAREHVWTMKREERQRIREAEEHPDE
jgi:glutaredoxin